ncbi:MAG TPA: hypothetical protein VFA09_22455 [Ktedonobacteraceae bacterium]|jgi:hypothetical protein|nr:hypothetical protein [Ktedonobacteraceae bacterium]
MADSEKNRNSNQDTGAVSNDQGFQQPGGQNADYNKMIRDEHLGTAKGEGEPEGGMGTGTQPDTALGSGRAPGGAATSNSTVAGGGTTGGTNPGGITTTDRGRPSMRDLTTNSDPIMGVGGRGDIAGQAPPKPIPEQDIHTEEKSRDQS